MPVGEFCRGRHQPIFTDGREISAGVQRVFALA
jgi:hypothetical protein